MATAVLLVACGDDVSDDSGGGGATSSGTGGSGTGGSGTGGSGTGGSGGSTDPQPGTIAVSASGITDANGKIMLVMTGMGTAGAAAACASITGDPGAVSNEVLKVSLSDNNPCELGEAKQFDPGFYTLSAGIYVPSEQTPEQCSEAEATVDGPQEVTLPAFGSCN